MRAPLAPSYVPAIVTRLVAVIACLALGVSAWSAEAGIAELRRAVPDVQIVTQDGQARAVYRRGGFLSGPGGSGKALPVAPGADLARDPHLPLKRFLASYPGAFGGGAELLESAELSSDAIAPRSGLRTTIWQQRIAGIPVLRATLVGNIARDGSLLAISSRFVGTRQRAAARLPADEPVSAATALTSALASVGAPAEVVALNDPADAERAQDFGAATTEHARASLTWCPSKGGVRLAWRTMYHLRGGYAYETLVDAQSGAVFAHRKRTITTCFHGSDQDNAAPPARAPADVLARAAALPVPDAPIAASPFTSVSMRVFAKESPKPMLPGLANPGISEPASEGPILVPIVHDPTASPDGWVDATRQTIGNNVDARLDQDGNNAPDRTRPTGSGAVGSALTFDFTPDLEVAAPNSTDANEDAAVVNLFYWCNLAHDRLYTHGFDEASGNFQNDNYGRGGAGNDRLIADAQDDTAFERNNANFTPDDDGRPGRIQMYLWTGTTPERDGDFDATIILHEYAHGVSTRLVGGGDGVNSLQAAGMGEGWSDFIALCLLVDSGDDPAGNYPVGAYAVHGNTSTSYYRGIRRHPYSTDMTDNPLTLADIDSDFPQVHDIGEIWAIALWEARANLIVKHGAVLGNALILDLVLDGMKLSPPEPTFIEARDAILLADLNLGGANQRELWAAFAKRGLGVGASVPDSSSTIGTVEHFEGQGDLLVSVETLRAGGAPGGPFTPASQTWTLRNALSAGDLTWTAATPSWLSASPAGGTLAPGATTTVTASFTATAAGFGSRTALADDVTFAWTGASVGTTDRAAMLTVVHNYDIDIAAAFAWVSPSGHTLLFDDGSASTISDDDDDLAVGIPLPFAFTYYGVAYPAGSTVSVSTNGMISMSSATGMTSYVNRDLPDPGTPNGIIAALWDDLICRLATSRVTVGTVGSAPARRLVVTWTDLCSFDHTISTAPFTFQIILEESSGRIVCQYLQVQPASTATGAGRVATVGIENEDGTSARRYSHLGSSLLSNGQAIRFRPAPAVRLAAASATVSEGAGSVILTAQLSGTRDADVTVSYATTAGTATAGTDFTSSSGTVTIPGGSLSATFAIPITADASDEGPETFTVQLSDPVEATLGSPLGAVVTIVDDDPPPTVRFTLASSPAVAENAGPIQVGLTLSAASTNQVSVRCRSLAGTATSPADFAPVDVVATFAPGSTTTTIPVHVVHDGVVESAESLRLTLSSPLNATLGATTTATLTISDTPAIRILSEPPLHAVPGTTYTYQLVTSATITTATLTNPPTGMTMSAGPVFTVTWTPTSGDMGVHHRMWIEVGNGPLTQTQDALIFVRDPATPGPAAAATPPAGKG